MLQFKKLMSDVKNNGYFVVMSYVMLFEISDQSKSFLFDVLLEE